MIKQILIRISLMMIFLVVALSILNQYGEKSETQFIKGISFSTIKFVDSNNRSMASGSLILAPSGKLLILTNYHVCEGFSDVINFRILPVTPHHGRVLKSNIKIDLCIVEAPKDILDYKIPLILASKSGYYEKVLALGYPLDGPLTPSYGFLLERRKIPIAMHDSKDCPDDSLKLNFGYYVSCIITMVVDITNLTTFPGNSGSPVVNLKGELVGVINSGDNRTNYGNIIPLEDVKEFLKDQ